MDSLPKRRKIKDNPYTIRNIDNKFYILFKDEMNNPQIIEVSKEIYNAFNQFELDDLKELNEFDRHIEHKELTEESIHNRRVKKIEGVDDYIIRKTSYEELMIAINHLTATQRRIKMYYFDELDLKTIATIEKTSFQMISKSIKQGIKKLKKILSK